jgi:hypothetical protein
VLFCSGDRVLSCSAFDKSNGSDPRKDVKDVVDDALEPYMADPPLVMLPSESVIVDAISELESSMETPQRRMA